MKTDKPAKVKPTDQPATLDQHYRFKDLKRLGIVGTWPTLYAWIKDRGFPEGKKISTHYRIWSASEVHDWLDRPRKQQPQQAA